MSDGNLIATILVGGFFGIGAVIYIVSTLFRIYDWLEGN